MLDGLFDLGLLARPAGGLVAFLACSIGFRLWAARKRRERDERLPEGWTLPERERLWGGLLGTAVAACLILIAVWGMNSTSQLRAGRLEAASLEAAPPPSAGRESLVGRASAAAAEKVAYGATVIVTRDRQLASKMSAVIARPGDATRAARTLTETERFSDHVRDPAFRDALVRADPRALREHAGVRALVRDPEFVEAARTLRLIDPAETDPDRMASQLADEIAPIGGTIDALARDREFMEALARTDVYERFRRGELVAIARDPDLQWMIERVGETLETQRSVAQARR